MSKASCACGGGLVAVIVAAAAVIVEKEHKEEHEHKQEQEQKHKREDSRSSQYHREALTVVEAVSHQEKSKPGEKERGTRRKVRRETATRQHETMADAMDVDGGAAGPASGDVHRRRSMSEDEERERRASIKAILADNSITPTEKRRSIQHLMDGRRSSTGTSSVTSSSSGGNPGPEYYEQQQQHLQQLHQMQRDAAQFGYAISNGGVAGMQVDQNGTVLVNGVAVPTPMGSGLQAGSAMLDASGQPPGGMGTISFPAVSPDAQIVPVSNEGTKRAEQTRPQCTHYQRNCTMVAPCCGAAFGCRICHDESPVLPPMMMMKMMRKYPRSSSLPGSFTDLQQPEDTHHNIDRFAVKEVICRLCYTKQSAKTNNCVTCGVQFGEYHCSICNLWMSNDEKPYHCKDCGFCRVGGAENFQHCHDCGMCIDKNLYSNHNCKSGKYKSNCPVCQEFLFSSRSASHEMPCGHAIHWECFRQLAAHDSRCPVCKKTAETRDRMMPTWNAMAAGVAFQAVPPELARVVNITCNDCEKSDDARAWHFLGVQCRNCSSFNTVVDRIVMSGEEAHEFLETLQTRTDLTESEDGNDRINRRRINRRRSLF